ncbi:MAG: transketolase family protein [Armatimonadota bacterium]
MAEIATRIAYGLELARIGDSYPDIVVLDADISKSTNTFHFTKKFPERSFNFGIAEQNMTAAAAGLATMGKIPLVNTYAVFASMRACEQVRTFICYPNLNVKIVVSHGGLAVGSDGPTHQGTEDLGVMRCMPNLTIVSPADGPATCKLLPQIIEHVGPVYFRLGRNPTPIVYDDSEEFTLGQAKLVREGKDVTLISTGIMVSECLIAVELLAQRSISARLIDIHTIKPIDRDAIVAAAEETGAIVTAEDHNIIGGLGSAVTEVVCETKPVPVERIGLRDVFGESGEPMALFDKYSMSARYIAEAAQRAISRKENPR